VSLDVGELVGYLRLDTKKAKDDIAKGESQIVGQASKAGAKAGKAAGSSFGADLKKGLIGGIGLAGGYAVFKTVTAFLGDSVRAASDLNETVSKGRNIFGSAARGVEDWSKKSDRALGLSQQAALAATAQFGDMFTQLGQGQQQAAKTSEKVVKLASDLGSFHNLGTEDVLERISAGFRGEYDSLQLLIPNISAARVQQEAMTETGKKNAAQLTANEKATATLAIIMKDGATAQGDFARTSGGLANQQKILAAQTDNLKAKVGAGLYPVVTAIVTFLNDKGIPALFGFASALGKTWDAMGPVIHTGAELLHLFTDLPPPVQASIGALIALAALRPRLLSFGSSLSSSVGGGAKAAGAGLETLRIHALYAGDAFKSAETRAKGLGAAVGYGARVGARGAISGLSSALGGPFGIAIAGATAAVGFFLVKHQQAKQRVDDLTAAIEADSGALGANTKATLANDLAKGDTIKNAKRLGISLSDLTGDLLGEAGAHERVQAAINAHAQALKSGTLRGTDDLAQAAFELSHSLGDEGGSLQEASQKAKDHAALMGETATASTDAAGAQKALGTEAGTTADAISGQTKEIKTWLETADAATGKTLDLRAANRDYQQALDDAVAAAKENGKTLDITTQKGRDNAASIDAMVTAALARADAQKAAHKSDQVVHDDLVAQRDRLVEVARKFGLSKDQAQAYINKLLKIPPVVNTKINFSTATAEARVAKLQGDLNKLSATLGDLPNAGVGRPGSKVHSAIGNILHFAGGGEAHTAQIAKGTTRVWNEPETGGEGYIPLAVGGKRPRAIAILKDINDRFGNPLGAGQGGMAVDKLVNVEHVHLLQGSSEEVAADLRFALVGLGVGG
jgi:hypothetical protein